MGLIWWRAPAFTTFDAARDSYRRILIINYTRFYSYFDNGHQHANKILYVRESEVFLSSKSVMANFQMIWQGKC